MNGRADERDAARTAWGAALTVYATVIAVVWSVGARGFFLYQVRDTPVPGRTDGTVHVIFADERSFLDLVFREPGWTAVGASLVVVPLWFFVGRKIASTEAWRCIGAVWALVPALFPPLLVASRPLGLGMTQHGAWGVLGAAGVALAAAFVVAPRPPRDPESVSDIEMRVLVRRHRKSFPRAAR